MSLYIPDQAMIKVISYSDGESTIRVSSFFSSPKSSTLNRNKFSSVLSDI